MGSFNFGKRAAQSAPAAAIELPTRCPSCRSDEISTTSRNPDVNAYWRCAGCGEVWNVARRQSAASGRYSWR